MHGPLGSLQTLKNSCGVAEAPVVKGEAGMQVQKQGDSVKLLASSGRAASIIMPDMVACQAELQLVDNVLIPASVRAPGWTLVWNIRPWLLSWAQVTRLRTITRWASACAAERHLHAYVSGMCKAC